MGGPLELTWAGVARHDLSLTGRFGLFGLMVSGSPLVCLFASWFTLPLVGGLDSACPIFAARAYSPGKRAGRRSIWTGKIGDKGTGKNKGKDKGKQGKKGRKGPPEPPWRRSRSGKGKAAREPAGPEPEEPEEPEEQNEPEEPEPCLPRPGPSRLRRPLRSRRPIGAQKRRLNRRVAGGRT